MYYVTVKCSPKEYSQLSFDDFFSGATKTNKFKEEYKYTFDTRTSIVIFLFWKLSITLEVSRCQVKDGRI